MANYYIDNWATIELIALQSGQRVETVFSYITDTMAITPGDAAAILNDWVADMLPLAAAALSQDVALLEAHLKTRFATFPNVEAIYDFTAGTVGTRTSGVQPGNVTIAIKQVTNILGRKYRGRNFWFGLVEGDCSGNILSSAEVLALSALFARNLTGFTGAGVTIIPGVASRVGNFITSVVGFGIENLLDSMRRRLTGRGD